MSGSGKEIGDCDLCGGTGKVTAGCAIGEPLIEADCWKCAGKNILARLRQIQDQELKDARSTLTRLRDGESVTDGDLIDAAFAFTARTDLANPIVPLMSYFIARFMHFAGITETPRGLKRDYFDERLTDDNY